MHIVIDARMVGKEKFGIARYVSNLVKALAAIDSQNKYTVLVQNDVLSSSVRAPNMVFKRCAIKWLSLEEQWRIPALLRELKPDIFHATSFVAPVMQPCKTIITIHDLFQLIFPEHFGFIKHIYYRLVIGRAIKNAAHIIAVSESTKKDLISIFKVEPRKITVTYEAAEDNFRPITDRDVIDKFRREKRLSDNFMLYVGNHKKHKNITTLLKAFKIFKANDARNHYLVMSGGKDEGIVAMAQAAGILPWLVFVKVDNDNELSLLYNAAQLFVFPSLYEGFGLPPLEAMACGTPVITANVSSLPEVIGDAGLLIDPLSVSNLARAMGQVLSDRPLAEKMAEKGLARARSFSWVKCAEETKNIYESQ
ncbi:MAG: glycosyltransferase family 1 protein [Candidatus Omnitrophica bacterium]|nr:glycosyltransferase family 1 protein [Candidatus Omnitrophota bacterium]